MSDEWSGAGYESAYEGKRMSVASRSSGLKQQTTASNKPLPQHNASR